MDQNDQSDENSSLSNSSIDSNDAVELSDVLDQVKIKIQNNFDDPTVKKGI